MMRYEISVPAVLESLRVAASFGDSVFQELPKLSNHGQLLHDLRLVTSEALTNAIRHAEAIDKPVSLAFEIDAAGITIIVTDHGIGFDPDSVTLPAFDEFPEGGYGIYIMKTIMDSVRYEMSGTGNRLVLSKSWARS